MQSSVQSQCNHLPQAHLVHSAPLPSSSYIVFTVDETHSIHCYQYPHLYAFWLFCSTHLYFCFACVLPTTSSCITPVVSALSVSDAFSSAPLDFEAVSSFFQAFSSILPFSYKFLFSPLLFTFALFIKNFLFLYLIFLQPC